MNGSMIDNESLLSSMLQRLESAGADAVAKASVAVPFPYLFQAAVRLKGHGVSWGSQDVSDQEKGAFTAEVSVAMLQDFEAEFSLVGHSERRARHGETDEAVARKTCGLLKGGVNPVVCVGESLDARDQGRAKDVVCHQVQVVAKAAQECGKLDQVTFAYEPIWAIGTGRSASAAQAQEIHAAIRAALSEINANAAQVVKLLYGGSVKASSARELFSQQDIDGALVGGASLDAQEFVDIICAAKE